MLEATGIRSKRIAAGIRDLQELQRQGAELLLRARKVEKAKRVAKLQPNGNGHANGAPVEATPMRLKREGSEPVVARAEPEPGDVPPPSASSTRN